MSYAPKILRRPQAADKLNGIVLKPFGEFFKPQRPTEDMWYIGNVENNMDPLKLRRLQIRTIMHEDLATEDLPWASPIPNCFLGTSPNSEDFAVPEIGSQVRVFFPSHDQNTPFYMGGETNEYNVHFLMRTTQIVTEEKIVLEIS